MQTASSPYRELTLEDLIDVYRNCMKKNSSRCNTCMLNDEYGDYCMEVRDRNTFKYLNELNDINGKRGRRK